MRKAPGVGSAPGQAAPVSTVRSQPQCRAWGAKRTGHDPLRSDLRPGSWDSCMEDRGLGPAEWFPKEQHHVTPLCSLSRIEHLGYGEEDRNLHLGGLAGTTGSLPEHSGLPQAGHRAQHRRELLHQPHPWVKGARECPCLQTVCTLFIKIKKPGCDPEEEGVLVREPPSPPAARLDPNFQSRLPGPADPDGAPSTATRLVHCEVERGASCGVSLA